MFDQRVDVLGTTDGKVRRTLLAGADAYRLTYTDDGKRLRGYGAIVVSEWNLDDGRNEPLERGHLDEIDDIAVTPGSPTCRSFEPMRNFITLAKA